MSDPSKKPDKPAKNKGRSVKDKTPKKPLSRKAVQRRDTYLQNIMRTIRHTILNVEQTDLHADFVRMYQEAKELGKINKNLAERIKLTLQPNPAWQKEVIPPREDYTSLDLFAAFMAGSGKQLAKDAPNTSAFYGKMSAAVAKCGRLYGHFLTYVKANTLQPLENYINNDLEKIRNEYYTLLKYKNIYDDVHHKLKLCSQDQIEEVSSELVECKTTFETKANEVTELLMRLPEHKENQRSAIRHMSLALRQYHDLSVQVMTNMLRETMDLQEGSSIGSASPVSGGR